VVQKRPNGHKIYQHLILQVPPKLTQIMIFGLKKCHLATLQRSTAEKNVLDSAESHDASVLFAA
jgi:hypothetical protein